MAFTNRWNQRVTKQQIYISLRLSTELLVFLH